MTKYSVILRDSDLLTSKSDMQIKPAHAGVILPANFFEEINAFLSDFSILEKINATDLFVFKDFKNDGLFTECHLSAEQLALKGTTDSSLDPQNQPEYRANREVVTDDPAF